MSTREDEGMFDKMMAYGLQDYIKRTVKEEVEKAMAGKNEPLTEFISHSDVAELLQVSKVTVYKYVRDGLITKHRVPGVRHNYYNRQEIIDLIKGQTK